MTRLVGFGGLRGWVLDTTSTGAQATALVPFSIHLQGV